MSKCVCTVCHCTFTCVSAFDMHRVGSFGDPIFAKRSSGKARRVIGQTKSTRRCLTEQEMRARGMAQNEKGWWMTRPSDVHWAEEPTGPLSATVE